MQKSVYTYAPQAGAASKRRTRFSFGSALMIWSALLAAGGPSSAQSPAGSIRGTVRDPQAALVPGASVTVFSNHASALASTATDASGSYHLDGLAAGSYIVEVRAPGFARYSVQGVQLGRGETRTVDASLQMEAARQQVVVTASGTALTPDEIAKSVSVLDHLDIEARDEPSLATALDTLPGLRVQQLGGLGGLTSIKIRGLRSEDTGVLFDGMRFRDITTPQGDASSFIQDFVDTNIDRIEVLRGAGSSLYGTNAIGGVINLISDAGGGPTHGSLLLEGGQLGTFRGKAQVAGGVLDNRLQYSAGLTHWNVTEGIGGNTPARITSGQGSVSYQLTPALQLIARMYAADSFSKQVGEPEAIGNLPALGIIDAAAPPASVLRLYEQGTPLSQLNLGSATFLPAPDDPDSTRAARFLAGAFTLNGHPSPKLNYSFAYQGTSTQSDFGNGPAGVGYQPFGGNTHSISSGMDQIASAQSSLQWTSHSLLNGGYEFEQENYTSRSRQPADAGDSRVDASQRSNAIFAQDQERYFDSRLILSGSFRVQFFHLNQPDFAPSQSAPYAGVVVGSPSNAYTGDGSAAWFFRSTSTKIRAHGSRGYRAPSIYERFGTYFDPIYGYSIYGDPRLTPEHTTSFDAGIDQGWWNNRVRASATYFYTRFENEILFSGAIDGATDPFGRFYGYVNGKGGLARGMETSVTMAPARSLDVMASYTYTNSQQGTPVVENIVRSLELPKHQFSVAATQRLGSRIFVNFTLVASSNYLAPVTSAATFASLPFRFNGIREADLGGSYRLPLSESRAVRFFARVTNLFNQDYFEAGFRTPGIGGTGGIQLEF